METIYKTLRELNSDELNCVSGAGGDAISNEDIGICVGWTEYKFDKTVNDWVAVREIPRVFEVEPLVEALYL